MITFKLLTFHGPQSYMSLKIRYRKFNFIHFRCPFTYKYIIAISISWKNDFYLLPRYREFQIIL